MRGGDVANIVHVKAEQRAQFRFFQQFLDAIEPLGAQPFKIDSFFPVYTHQAIGLECHDSAPSVCGLYTRPQSVFASWTTASGVGTVWSSSTGEKGTGTSIAPIRLTGASR